MKVHTGFEQGSLEWNQARAGVVTASEMERLVTPLGKIKTGEGPKTYLMEKLAERWLQGPLPSADAKADVWDLQQGHFLEEYARPAFTVETGLVAVRAAFITSDDGNVGCSPDGLIADNSGLELKCPHIEKHIRYLLDGVVPPDYVLQVQGSMFVTGFDHWYFCSYRRKMPIFVLKVERDEKFQGALGIAIDTFLEELDEQWKMLCEKNGGPPPPRRPMNLTPESMADPRAGMFQGVKDDQH